MEKIISEIMGDVNSIKGNILFRKVKIDCVKGNMPDAKNNKGNVIKI
jgi:hypothetical protein